MTEDEKLIQEVQDQCEYFAKGIINSLCKRAIRKINSWNIHIGTDDYPSSFNFFNILSIELSLIHISSVILRIVVLTVIFVIEDFA